MSDKYIQCAICRRSVSENNGYELGHSIKDSKNVMRPHFRAQGFVCKNCYEKHVNGMRGIYLCLFVLGIGFAVLLSIWFWYNYM